MSNLIRLVTGVLCIVFGLFFVFLGIVSLTDYITAFVGLFFVVVGVYIIFNKKEDEVEQIKESK